DQRHDDLAALIERRVQHTDDAAIRLRRGGSQLEHFGDDVQCVTWPNRDFPTDLVEAWRPETRSREGTGLEEQLERQGGGLKSTGDEASVDCLLRRLRVEMEYLRIVELAEIHDEILGNE